MLDFTLERDLMAAGYSKICGVDEAGRGPLFGPVAAAACILPYGINIPGLDDSKRLTEKKRENLYTIITREAVDWAVATATVEEIEEYNILEASLLAMRRAIDSLTSKPDFALIDGNAERDFGISSRCVVHGDAISPSIAAASIIAKVTRDRLCRELELLYPGYGIAKHKGYGTKQHTDAIRLLGLTPQHRKSFIHIDRVYHIGGCEKDGKSFIHIDGYEK